MEKDSAKEICRRFAKLEGERDTWEDTWQRIAPYCIPQKNNITDERVPGTRLPAYVYDTTAIDSVNIIAAGLQGHFTSPAQRWFSLRMLNATLQDDKDVKEWLKDSEDKIYDALNNSNFDEEIHEFYQDLVVFGTADLYEEEDPEDQIRFDCRHIREIFIVEDSRGRVATVFRLFEYTAEQAFERWKGEAGEKVQKAIAKKEYDKKFKFLHVVGPRHQRDVAKSDNLNKPFYSRTINYDEKKDVQVSGYDEMPYFVVRWDKVSNEKYGYSPAMKAEGDIKTANSIKEDMLEAGAKIVNPPLDVPHDGYLLPLDISPGAINYRNTAEPTDTIKQLDIKPDLPAGFEMLEGERKNIRRHFLVELFLMMEHGPKGMTATEVIQRTEEKMLIIGPSLGRIKKEGTDQILRRTFSLLTRKKIINEPPKKIQEAQAKNEAGYKIQYESRLARAQRFAQSQSVQNFLAVVGGMTNLSPEVVDNIDLDFIIRELAEIYGMNPKAIRDDKTVKAIREARRQAEEARQALELAKMGADVGKTASEIDKNAKETTGAATA